MSYIEMSLSKGEKIENIFKQHWFVWVPITLMILLGFLTVITWFIAIYMYLNYKNLEQGVTNKRVIRKTGIISRKTDEMKLASIETIGIDQGILGRIFGFGTVKITGRGVSDVIFKGIDDPISVKRGIESIGEEPSQSYKKTSDFRKKGSNSALHQEEDRTNVYVID